MSTARDSLPRLAWVVFLVLWFLRPGAALAGSDYSDVPFSLRLPPAFIRFTEVSAGGGGTSASRWSSAINPASAGWMELPYKFGVVVAPYYSPVLFEQGNRLHITGESVTWDTRRWGTFQPTVAQIRSNRHRDRQQLTFDYRVDTFQLTWGKRLGDFGVGANFNFSQAEVVYKMGQMRVSESHAESYRFRLGGLYQPAEKWLTGLVFEYGFAPFRAKQLDLRQFPPAWVKSTGVPQQVVVRPGVSYEYADYSTVFLDYQFGFFDNDLGGHFYNHRFSTGVDHRLLEWLFVRAGASVDVRGNAGVTCGVGIHLSRHCGLDVGYQYDVLPELRPEFGRAHVVQITFSLRL